MRTISITEQQPEVGIWVLVWHQNTWLKGCRLHDGWRIIYADGQHDYDNAIVTHWTYLPPEPGDESPSSDPAEVLVVALKEIASPISRLTKKEIKYLADERLKSYEQLKQQ